MMQSDAANPEGKISHLFVFADSEQIQIIYSLILKIRRMMSFLCLEHFPV